MSKSTKLTHIQWLKLYERLKKDNPLSTFMLRDRMRERLGFLNRDYSSYNPSTNRYDACVYLDWYSEPKRTMFLLKYSDYLQADANTNV